MDFVSQYKNDLDKIELTVLTVDAFVAVTGLSPDVPVPQFEKTVPTLKSPDYVSAETISILEDSFASAVRSIMAGNFFLSLLMATAL